MLPGLKHWGMEFANICNVVDVHQLGAAVTYPTNSESTHTTPPAGPAAPGLPISKNHAAPSAGRMDVLVALGLAVLTALLAYLGYRQLMPGILEASTSDYWFDSDTWGILEQLTDRQSDWHHRARRHPLFGIVMYPVMWLLTRGLGLAPIAAAAVVVSGTAAVWVTLSYILLRAMRCTRPEAVLFCLLAASSASAIFWLPVLDTFSLGAVTIMGSLALVVISKTQAGSKVWPFAIVGALTLGITVTNGWAFLVVIFLLFPPRRAILLGLSSVVLLGALWLVQRPIFPASALFNVHSAQYESNYMFHPLSQGPAASAKTMLIHSVVMPSPVAGRTVDGTEIMSVQGAPIGSGGLLVWAGTIGWALLLGVTIVALLRWGAPKLIQALLLVLGGQLALHLVFGTEVFLFSLHFAPLLVLLTAWTMRTPLRPIAMILATLLLPIVAFNNVEKFVGASKHINVLAQEHRSFDARIGELTEPGTIVVIGIAPKMLLKVPEGVPEALGANPPGPVPTGDRAITARIGWELSYDHWSLVNIEEFRGRGARYFVTRYVEGLLEGTGFSGELERHFRLVERTGSWAIFDLVPSES
jgi:hypothetical protein